MKNFERLGAEMSKKGRENNFLQIRKEKKLEYQLGARRVNAEAEVDTPEAQADRARKEAAQLEILSTPNMLLNSANMKSGNLDLQSEALHFYRLVLSRPSTKDSELMDVLLGDGILPYICEFISNFDTPDCQINAVWCITNFACGSATVLDALHQHGVAPLLVDMLVHIPANDNGKINLRDHCIWALANLCAVKEDIRQSVIAKGVATIILEDLGLQASITGRVPHNANPSLITLRYMAWLLCNIGKSLQYAYLTCLPEIIQGLAFLIQLEDPNIFVDTFRFIACFCLESSNEAIVTTSLESMLEYGMFSRIMIILNKCPYLDSSAKACSHMNMSADVKPLLKTSDVRFYAVRALSKALILGDIRQKCGLIVASRTLADAYPLHIQLSIDTEYYTWYRLHFADRDDQLEYRNDPSSRNKPNGTKLGTIIAESSGEYLSSATPDSILRDVDATIISLLKTMRAVHPIDDQFIPSLFRMPSQLPPDIALGKSLGQIIFENIVQIMNRGLSNSVKMASSFILCLFLSSDDILKEICDTLCRTVGDPRRVASDIREAVKDALSTNDIEVLTALLTSANKAIIYFSRLNIKWTDDEFIDKISFFIHYKNVNIQKAASDIQATIDRIDEYF